MTEIDVGRAFVGVCAAWCLYALLKPNLKVIGATREPLPPLHGRIVMALALAFALFVNYLAWR